MCLLCSAAWGLHGPAEAEKGHGGLFEQAADPRMVWWLLSIEQIVCRKHTQDCQG